MVREAVGNNNAVVVAHPDDEVLWAGGLIARFSDRQWTVIACSSPVDDPKRVPAFQRACAAIGAHGIVLPIDDRGIEQPLEHLDFLGAELLTGDFDLVVTHGEQGEYGHPHHKQVHEYVAANFRGPILTFGWHPGGEGDHRIDLASTEQEAKDRALRCYDHIYDSLVSAYFVRHRVPRNYETYDVVV